MVYSSPFVVRGGSEDAELRQTIEALGRLTSGLLRSDARVTPLPMVGTCQSCGRPSAFLRLIDRRLDALLGSWPYSPRFIESIATRENYFCIWCRRNYRTRTLASVLWPHAIGASVYEAGTFTALAPRLSKRAKRYEVSEFIDGARPGDVVHGIRHENLEELTWSAGEFDVVVTTEVFEHVVDPWRAFGEVRRVLRRGGRHIFTVPDLEDTVTRSRGSMPPVMHLDALRPEGVPVRTDFGVDLPELLAPYGFETRVHGFPDERPVTRVYESVAV